MRLLLVAILVSLSAFSAQSQELQVAGSNSAEIDNPTLERQVEKRLEALGYKDLQLEQDVLVVRAKDVTDQAVVLLVDPDTLLNLKIYDPDEEPSTTGSGSSSR
jgi:flagellar basal body rod protein FlgC